MRSLTNAVTVGILAVGVAVGLYFAIAFVTREAGEGYRVWALLDDARGLVTRSRVLMAGISVGSIDSLELQGDKARVNLRIREDVKLFCDATISKEATSFIGEYNVSLTRGKDESCVIPDGGRIVNVIPSSSIDQVVQRAGAMASDMQRIAADISGVVHDVRDVSTRAAELFASEEGAARIQRMLDNVEQITVSVRQFVEDNAAGVGESVDTVSQVAADAAPKVERILNDLAAFSSDIRQLVEETRAGVGEGVTNVRETLETLQRALERLDATLADVQTVAGGVAQGEGTVGRLVRDDTLIDEVEGFVHEARGVVTDVGELVTDVGDFATSLTRLQTVVELRTEYNFFANTLKTYLALRLQPKEDKYYLLELVDDPRGSVSTVDRTTLSSADPGYVRERETVRTDAFRFSLMLARRLGFATFRFGIKESTGGLGVDLHFLQDALELSMDVFSIGTDTYPRIKFVAALEFLRGLYIVGGADDVLNVARDFFIGAQLRFNDEDLKAILTFAPTSIASSQ